MAHLTGTHLVVAHLAVAYLTGTHLVVAHLAVAHLTGTHLAVAHLARKTDRLTPGAEISMLWPFFGNMAPLPSSLSDSEEGQVVCPRNDWRHYQRD